MTSNALLAASGVLGMGGLMRFLHFPTDPQPKTAFDLGPASDYPPGSRTVLADIPAVLIHNDDGFAALSLVCSHLGCTVKPDEGDFICPCHGSRFNEQGAALRGPAGKPLRLLRVETTDDDQLRLFLS
ncbi:MAG: Rieske 2Fe-2S domain-containing protein [Anaerolineae bacterium]|nr:Rieske 2Fe-2S domain-containing protein [Anaerolineae bacterium]